MAAIVNINEGWQDHSGKEVREFLQKELSAKVGYQVIPATKQDDGFYHIWGFYSKESYDKYMEDKQANASLLLFDNTIPISTDKGVTYSARLYTSANLNSPVVVIEKKHEVGLRFCGIMAENSEIQNAGIMGTLTFQQSTNGGTTWSVVGTENIISRDTTDETYDTFDIGKYFTSTNPQQLRVRASYTVYDDEGNVIATAQSAWLTWTSITYTQLSVQNMQDWSRPIMASEGTFPLSFAITGEVDKYLHVQISGSTGTYTYVEMIPAATQYPSTTPKTWTEAEKSNIGILTHGVHSVTAWLTCDDGSGHLGSDGYPDAIKSETIINRFMVVNTATEGADLTKRYLILQQVQTNVVNYVRTVLTSFAVWIPSEDPTIASGETMEIAIRLTDAADNSEGTDYTTEYLASNMQVASLTKYDVDGTVEIESTTSSTQITEYLSYLRFFRYADDGSYINFLYESTRQKFVTITVDNKENYSPTAGAYLIINPKTRNNSEKDKFKLYNQVTGEEIPSVWEGFGGVNDTWTMDSDGQRVLRVLAGEKLTIGVEPFESFRTDAKAKLTLDIIFAVRNITAEDAPAIDICQEVGSQIYGMRLRPLEGMVMAAGKTVEEDQNFAWEEDEKVHLTLTVNPEVIAKADDELTWMKLNGAESKPLSLAKVYVNGKPEREVDYTPTTTTWITGDGYGGIKIGNSNADIDIYGIRIYRTALSSEAVLQNVVSSRTDAEEKYALKSANDIMTNGRISVTKCRNKGYRTLTLYGLDQYKNEQDKGGRPCYWEIHHDNPALSGTIGKAAYIAYLNDDKIAGKCLQVTPQGSTANTYWENNEQTKVDSISYVVNILFSKLHEDFGWKESMSTGEGCSNPLYLDGRQIDYTVYQALSDDDKKRVRIDVYDGWFDGNGWSSVDAECGMYHGKFYTSEVGGAKCTKLVNKINYASPMQSHKYGATRLYNDVMKAVTGGTGVMRENPQVRFSVLETPYMFFTCHPNDGGKVEYRGLCTFGDGKFDKTVFGYNSNKATFGFEGLNNNLPLCDFRVPADGKVVYNPDDEAWCYAGVKSFEYGLGATVKDTDGNKIPTAFNESFFRKYVNFIYSHNVRMRHYNGTWDSFLKEWEAMIASSEEGSQEKVSEMKLYQYWCTQGGKAYNLMRYDHDSNEWVDAGVWDDDSEQYISGARDLSTYYMTADAFTAWKEGSDYGDYPVLGEMFVAAICEHFKANAGKVMHVQNHQTHYNLVNFMLAGTDNCSKNTYYQYDPVTGVVWLDQDDLDTILCTDNNGRQTKLYFIDRIHDTEDYINGYKGHTDYEGKASALFDLMEAAWEKNGTELRANMRQVLTAMSSLVSTNEPYGTSVWGCIRKYFFSTQEYFPAIAFSEQGRLRYEFPKSFGYISSGNQSRGIDPITQQVGSCLERERQYMRRRIALICSYAAWGDFSSGAVSGVTGLGDSGASLALSPGSGNTGSEYTFEVVPHQWLYPTGTKDRDVIDPHARVAPGETYALTLAKAGDISGDSSVSLSALNYYRKIGNIGNMTVGNNTLSVLAKRLTHFVATPTNPNSKFAPKNISLSTPNLQYLSLNGCYTQTGTRDYTALTRLESIDLRGTGITEPKLPESSVLSEVRLPETTETLALANVPSLAVCTLDGYSAIKELSIDESPKISTKVFVSNIFYASNRSLKTLTLKKLQWTGVAASMLTWMMTLESCTIDGSIELVNTDDLPYGTVISLIDKYGDIQDVANTLYVSYKKNPINSISVSGSKYIRETGIWDDWDIAIVPTRGNNVAIKDGRPDITWELIGDEVGSYAEFVDNVKGVVNVKKVETAIYPTKFTLHVKMGLTGGSSLEYNKTVGFCRRVPKLGDFAYADGTFDDEFDDGLELVGLVIHTKVLEWLDEEKGIPSRMDLVTYAKDNAVVKSTDETFNTSSLPWGLYSDTSNANGFSTEVGAEIVEATGLKSAFDTDLKNYTSSGIASPTDSSSRDYRYIRDTFIDDSTDDGYAVITTGSASDFQVEQNGQTIIDHANKIIGLYLVEAQPTTPTELADAMQNLVNKATEEGATTPTRYRQMYFPTEYACHLYEPTVSDNAKLADCYKRGNWHLPSLGLLARIYNFYYNSCGRETYENGGRLSADNANESPDTEARTPLFANALKRMGGTSRGFTMPSNGSYYWSSTENGSGNAWFVSFGSGSVNSSNKYGSGVARGVAAFTYDV